MGRRWVGVLEQNGDSRRRGGFSLLETLVVVGSVTALVAGFYLHWASGQRQSLALDFQATALQSAQLVVAHLQQDFDSLVPGPLGTTYAAPTPSEAVALSRVVGPTVTGGLPLDDQDRPITERVVYRFDPTSRMVHRNDEPIRAGPFETVEFTFFPARPGDPTPPYGDTLAVRLVVVPPEAIGRVTPKTPRAEFSLVLHSPQGTANHTHDLWAGDP